MKDRRFPAAVLAVSLLIVAFVACMWLRLFDVDIRRAIADLGEAAAATTTACIAAVVAVRHHGRRRWTWALVAGSAASWAVGQTLWSWFELVDHQLAPTPSLADVFFLGSTVIGVPVVFAFPAIASQGRRLVIALDGLIIAAGLLLTSWVTILPVLFGNGSDPLKSALDAVGPLNDILLGAFLLSLASRAPKVIRTSATLLVAGLMMSALADSGFAYLIATQQYVSGGFVDVFWFSGELILTLGAAHALIHPWPEHKAAYEPPGAFRLLLPYIPMAIASALAVRRGLQPGGLTPGMFLVLVVMVGLVVVRQFLTLADNRRLLTVLGSRERQLEVQANHDALTGLANRTLFRRRVEQALAMADPGDGNQAAVIFIDLDDFKFVNDTLGHDAGDQLLVQVAGRLRACLRADDLAARLGGDEFAVLLSGVRGPAEALQVADRVLSALQQPVDLGLAAVAPRGTLGVALGHRGDSDAASLLSQADVAMYLAKARGKGTVEVFADGMHDAVVERLMRRSQLDKALERNQFTLLYQPIVDVATRSAVGVEALLRWRHPELGLLAPADFMEDLESTGLILPVGRWVLETAIAQVATWRALGLRCTTNINISPQQLRDPGLVDALRAALETHGVVPDSVVLELTESALPIDLSAVRVRLQLLRDVGVRLALDDFGTGSSALSHLRAFPVQLLKIDRSFVDDTGDEGSETTLAEALVRLGSALGVETIAEGIESETQHRAMASYGCRLAQGFLYAQPLAPAEIPAVFSAGARAAAATG